jgi:hypothetical protein
MAQHTSRQRSHLLICQPYLEAMRLSGTENSITRQASDPAAFAKPRKVEKAQENLEKRKATQKVGDFSLALRLQALVLAEASLSYDQIREITGIDTKLLDKIRKVARDRGYDPTVSLQMKEEYVANLVDTARPAGRPAKHRPETEAGTLQHSPDHRRMPAAAAMPSPFISVLPIPQLPPTSPWNLLTTSHNPHHTLHQDLTDPALR